MKTVFTEEEAILITIEKGYDGSEFDVKRWKERKVLPPGGSMDKLIRKLNTIYHKVEVEGKGRRRKYILINEKKCVGTIEYGYVGRAKTKDDYFYNENPIIYCITNNKTNKKYIGKTNKWLSDIHSGYNIGHKDSSHLLYKSDMCLDMRENSFDDFSWDILEYLEIEDDFIKKKNDWIRKMLDEGHFLYNKRYVYNKNSKLKRSKKLRITNLSSNPKAPIIKNRNSVYRFLNARDEIIYVGKTSSLIQRLRNHSHLPDMCYEETKSIHYLELATKTEMSIKEIYYINKWNPKYNISSNYHEEEKFLMDETEDMWVERTDIRMD